MAWLETRLMDKYCGTPTLNDALCCLSTMLTILRAIRCSACELSLQVTRH